MEILSPRSKSWETAQIKAKIQKSFFAFAAKSAYLPAHFNTCKTYYVYPAHNFQVYIHFTVQ